MAISSVDADFADVVPFLKTKGLLPQPSPATLTDHAKKIHRATYSLILWRFRLKKVPDHGRPFIEEIASDALQILPQVLMGYVKTTNLLIRGIIENTLRHVYFSDHPIEFDRMNRERKWYMTMENLRDYAKIHPSFVASESRFDAMGKLNTLYDELSAGIHGRTVQDLEMRIALKKIGYDERVARRHVKFIERCAESANFLLAIFNVDRMAAFQKEDRRIILYTMCPRARQALKDLA
jgi:hypothetical protein